LALTKLGEILVQSGQYSDAAAVLRQSLPLLADQKDHRAQEKVLTSLQKALSQLDAVGDQSIR